MSIRGTVEIKVIYEKQSPNRSTVYNIKKLSFRFLERVPLIFSVIISNESYL
jgi:hypothetical protein